MNTCGGNGTRNKTIVLRGTLKLKQQTNADRIRAMSAEELAEFESERMCCPPGKPGCEANNLTCDNCEKCWLGWLKQEVPTDG